MKGSLGASLVNVIFVTIVAVLAMDVGITMLHQTRVNEGKRQISYRNEVIIKAGSFPEKTLEYLVSFGERQGRAVMLPQEQLTQTWTYGGNACAVYYSKKNVNYYYNADAFVKTLKQKKGLYLIENGDLHYIESIQDKKILFKNSEYSLFRK